MLLLSDSDFCSSLLQVQTAGKLRANYPLLIPRTAGSAALTALGSEEVEAEKSPAQTSWA